jgi:hypothetical protein
MKRWMFLAILAALLCAGAFAQLPQRPQIKLPIPTGPKKETYPGFIVVKYTLEVADKIELQPAQTDAERAISTEFVNRIPNSGWTLWTYPRILKFEAVRDQFKGESGVVAVQPLNRVYPLWTDPNDPDWGAYETGEEYILDLGENEGLSFKRLWHLDEISAVGGWTRWPNQWYTASTKPASAPILAVIDTGCDMGHPDFMNAGGTDTGTSFGGQLYKNRSRYFSFGAVKSTNASDQNGHGTHVTGLALAAGNNGGFVDHGVIGTGYAARGMILKVFDAQNNASDYDAAAAMYYAVDNGAVVINMSLGTENFSQLFQDATTYAWQKGSLIVAAGNESGGGGGDLGPIYPAACSGALGVAAAGPDQSWAYHYSGTGMYVDIAAPGGELIESTDYIIIQYDFSTSMRTRGYLEELSDAGAIYPPYTRNYSYLLGTSMASPLVAGAAANYFGMKNWKIGFWRNVSVYQALQKSADGVMGAAHGGWEPYQGYGCLNMDALMNGYTTRGADGGGMEGIVYSNATPTPNVAVRAKKVASNGSLTGLTFTTTTNQHGMFRFDVLAPGTYEVWTAPNGLLKAKRFQIFAGCDTTGLDFWCGSYTGDTTAPVYAKLLVNRGAGTRVTLTHWAYDTETGIDKITYQVGTTSGGAEVMNDTEIYTRTPTSVTMVLPSSLVVGNTYYLTGKVTNGAGTTTTQTVSFVAK